MRVLILVLVISLMLVGCCTHDTAQQAVRDAISVNEGHMGDKSLPEPARLIAQDNLDFNYQVLFYLDGITEDKIPQEVLVRIKAREAARKGGGE